MNKQQVRNEMRRKRERYPHIHRDSVQIWDTLEKSLVYRRAKSVFTYCSYGSEVETYFWLETVKRQGKRLCLPRIRENYQMDFYELAKAAHMERNQYGIYEPSPWENQWIPDQDTLIIVPGLAFDLSGGRIGYGGGYYDRYLQRYPGSVAMGLGFDFQLVEETLPTEAEDQRLQYLLLPKGLYDVKRGSWI